MSWFARFDVDIKTVHIAGITDSYTWHKKLWECYPRDPAAKRDFLTRIDQLEGAFRVWMLSKKEPARPEWCPPDCFTLKKVASSFLTHKHYAFDLRTNPVKTIVQRGPNGETLLQPNGKRKHGKRIPIVRCEELCAWLTRKGQVRCRDKNTGKNVPGGFRIVEGSRHPLEITPMIESHFRKKGQAAYHGGVQFRGILEVTDQNHFIETYYAGIGSAKAFGFGLLLLAPIEM
jgi:CRISPR system Cascade subunit CasE